MLDELLPERSIYVSIIACIGGRRILNGGSGVLGIGSRYYKPSADEDELERKGYLELNE